VVLIMVNSPEPDPLLFDAGVIAVPPKLRKTLLSEVYEGEDFDRISSTLQGLTYKEMVEVLHMTIVMFSEITAANVQMTRRSVIKSVMGVRHIHEDGAPYIPNKMLSDWFFTDGVLFHQDQHPMLRPKGLLLKGKPGTGKTEGAKWLATELQVPLYLLDVSALSSKYYSESERNLISALRQIEQLSPCVMLIDEVEKLFVQTEDSGTTGRLLSSLLWWLQERTANVLTVMTTNNEDKIPSELYRVGRIDTALTFPLLTAEQGMTFGRDIMKRYESIFKMSTDGWYIGLEQECSHAQVVDKVLRLFKEEVINSMKC
jgi:hypothetical protein